MMILNTVLREVGRYAMIYCNIRGIMLVFFHFYLFIYLFIKNKEGDVLKGVLSVIEYDRKYHDRFLVKSITKKKGKKVRMKNCKYLICSFFPRLIAKF